MKVNPKSKQGCKQLRDLAPGDLFRLRGSETILMKLVKLSDYPCNMVNIDNGYAGYERETSVVIPVDGEFVEK